MDTRIATSLTSAVLLFAANVAAAWPPSERTVDGLPVYSNGVLIGRLVTIDTRNALEIDLITSKGYVVGIDATTGNFTSNYVDSVFFSNTGCTGTAYFGGHPDLWRYSQGYVFGQKNTVAGTPNNVYYVPRGSTISYLPAASYEILNTGTCYALGGGYYNNFAVAYPNEEKITGVPTAGYVLPVVFGLPLP